MLRDFTPALYETLAPFSTLLLELCLRAVDSQRIQKKKDKIVNNDERPLNDINKYRKPVAPFSHYNIYPSWHNNFSQDTHGDSLQARAPEMGGRNPCYCLE